jgi:uncharacterized protein (TIGR02246 family)
MKRKSEICRFIVSGLVVIGLLIVGAPGIAQESETPQADAALREMITKHDKALSEHDLEGVLATYSPSSTIVLLGTGPGERWIGQEEIADAYTHFFMDFDQGTLSTECTWSSIDARGDFASILAMCQFTDYLKNLKREYAINISAVVEKIDDQWYFVTFHYSNLTDID